MIGYWLFASKPIENLFYLRMAIFEIPKYCFIIKLPACWGADVSIEIYELLLLFTIISPCFDESFCHDPFYVTFLNDFLFFIEQIALKVYRKSFLQFPKFYIHTLLWPYSVCYGTIHKVRTIHFCFDPLPPPWSVGTLWMVPTGTLKLPVKKYLLHRIAHLPSHVCTIPP